MTKKERALLAVQTLEEVYPQATCALQYEKPYELLIAVRLSAQCTDARVNQITPKLFAAYPTLESLAAADIADLEDIVRPCGFFHMKAKSIKEMSAQLILNFGGVGAGQYGRSAVPVRRGTQNSKSDPGRRLRQAGNRGGYPLYPHYRAAGADQVQRSRTGGERPPAADPAGALFGLLPPCGMVRQRHLPCQKTAVQGMSHGGILPVTERISERFIGTGQGKCCGMHRESA